ncbi:hypothetical protein [Moheibacter lacus]|uniref:Uncharacterized protein n=1 Tax=Moheibacter lacus TaxID=2745851 RepID=A0A838ZRG9_9FLAO|nr:hypothetical protein [Moheibacter lacus]MBA5628923.1 hypothetical protein [Moheibacter lacus]
MARQKGIIKIKGTIGDMTFYKSKDGYMVREKGGIDGNRIANDPAFQRTRENGAEFGRAGKAGKLLRTAFRPILLKSSDSRMVGRFTRELLRVIQSDSVNARGERTLSQGDLNLLTGFEFNIQGKLSTTFFAPYITTMNRTSGEMSVDIDPFVPNNMIGSPEGATHFQIISGAAEVDFVNETYNLAISETPHMVLDGVMTTAINQVNTLTPDSTQALFLLLGVAFFQDINGEMYPLRNGAYNPMSLVKLENAV